MRIAALLLCLAFSVDQSLQEDVLFEKDAVYGKAGGEELKLNIARPRVQTGPAACVVFLHGGGWTMGSRNFHDPQIRELAGKGYVAATIGYRFAPKHIFPAQVEDVKCAVRFLRANAGKYRIDKDRIGAVGFSSGAHLAMLLGTMDKEDGCEGESGNPEQPSKVNAVVAWYGAADFTAPDWPVLSGRLHFQLCGGSREDKPDAYRKASPLTYVNAGDAPMLLFQGTKDSLVPWTQAILMAEALTRAGVYGRADLIVGAGHGWGGEEFARTFEATTAFLDQILRPRTK